MPNKFGKPKMGILDKLKFWKKEEPAEFELGRYPPLADQVMPGQPGMELGMGGMIPQGRPGITEMPGEDIGPAPLPPNMYGTPDAAASQPAMWPARPAPATFAPAPRVAPMQAMHPPADLGRDMQVVQAKLDTLKALLDSVISKLERIERAQQPKEEEAVPLRLAGRGLASSSPSEAWRDVRRWR